MKTAIVLGVGRCGSSMVAGMIHKMGVSMGKIFIEPDDYNKAGYWEDASFMGIQNKMLQSIDRSWWNPPELGKWELDKIPTKLTSQIVKLIEKRNVQKVSWGWKDPRTYYLLPLYYSKLTCPNYIIVHRNPLSIAKSIMFRDKQIKSLRDALCLVQKHYERLLSVCNYNACACTDPQLHLNYEQIVEDPTEAIIDISKLLEIDLTDKQINDITHTVKPNLKTW